jgi:hypothetical protein
MNPVDHDILGNPIYAAHDLLARSIPAPIPGVNVNVSLDKSAVVNGRPLAEYLIHKRLEDLIAYADSVGLNFEVVRVSHYPPETGKHAPIVNIWLKREFTRPE